MSFDDVDDGGSFFSTGSPFFLTSPASPCQPTSTSKSKAKAFVLSCFPRLVRRRAASWFQDVRHTWWPLLADLSPKLARLGTLASTVGKNLSQILVLLTFAACIYLFSVNFSSFQHLVIIFLQWIRTLGMLGGVIYVLATALSNLVFIPTTLATLAAGYMFGLWFGFLFAYAGCCLGAVIAFVLGRTLFRSWVSSLARQYPKVALMDQAIGKKAVGWKIVLLLRLSPMLPYNVLNYVLSVTRVPFMDYFLASIAGMFPGVAVFTYFGSLSHDLSSIFSFSAEGMSGADGGHQNLVLYAGFIFSLGAFVLLSYFAANAIKKELKKIEEENEANEKRDRELDLMEKQKLKQKQEDEEKAAKEPAVISGPAAQLRQIDEALAEVRSGGGSSSSNGSIGVVSIRDDEWPGFEQNRSCGMRKNLSWVDASVA